MRKFQIRTNTKTMLSDTSTPVSIYLRIRDEFPRSLLLESSDYHASENSYSFICFEPLAWLEADNGKCTEVYPDGSNITTPLTSPVVFRERLNSFTASLKPDHDVKDVAVNGLFGYCSYDAVKYFESIEINAPLKEECRIPELHYGFYKYIIAINHFQNTLQITENLVNGEKSDSARIETLISSRNLASYPFMKNGAEHSNITDGEYKDMVSGGKKHCHRGDVFQIVLSRQFSQPFKGDEFNVYRALRSINPSPYLFYFDYGSYKIFGSSPEAHLKINKGIAVINPIAGTFKRTGDDERDKELAARLSEDVKENAEHVMLVDLARNDLSKNAGNVKVDIYREVQFYSHVIHLVSSVSGKLKEGSGTADMMMASFPAGTLSGAPKFRAMQLIDGFENQRRGYYGGAIGFFGFDGSLNHAIMIRTFLSRGNILFYQAGAGIVALSDEEKELQEVNSKLGALKKAIEMACDLVK
jgi:anthranilate synthase component I